ncbi:hypothetical protein CCHR01_02892 [Colletotrichum chrysophilum]|uniref:Uncharacterized protein n=1 Tax=Colletotrichum chrysophilum TaxID=1836956 RepID=A0AAD9AW90_9PEZI|nr:hypothetical protein CCHR01_02892 [Colletotrichum chrysophilum]
MILTVSAISITPSPHPFCRVPSFPFVLRTILPPSPTCRSIHSPSCLPCHGVAAGQAAFPTSKKKVLTVDMPLVVVVVGGTSLCSVVRPPPLAACAHNRIPASPRLSARTTLMWRVLYMIRKGEASLRGGNHARKKAPGAMGGGVSDRVQRPTAQDPTLFALGRRAPSPKSASPSPTARQRPNARDSRNAERRPSVVRVVSCRVMSCCPPLPACFQQHQGAHDGVLLPRRIRMRDADAGGCGAAADLGLGQFWTTTNRNMYITPVSVGERRAGLFPPRY